MASPQKDTFTDLTEDQRRRVFQFAQQHSLPYQQQAQRFRDELQTTLQMQSAAQFFQPSFPLSWTTIAWLVLLTIFLIPHFVFLLYNLNVVQVNWVYSISYHSQALVLLSAFVYGSFVSSLVLYIRQRRLERLLGESQYRERRWQAELQQTTAKLTKMKEAASKIVVPYSLDSLVDMGVSDFVEVGSNKRKLRALPMDAGVD